MKEKYINQIKAIGQHLIDNAENILFDIEIEHIREINIVSNIRCDEVPNVSKIKKLWGKCDKTYKKSLEKCERS